MANHKSAKKRTRQTVVKTLRNKIATTKARNVLKSLRTAITEKNKETASGLLTKAQSQLSKLAKAGIIKSNNSARKVSRLTKQVKSL